MSTAEDREWDAYQDRILDDQEAAREYEYDEREAALTDWERNR